MIHNEVTNLYSERGNLLASNGLAARAKGAATTLPPLSVHLHPSTEHTYSVRRDSRRTQGGRAGRRMRPAQPERAAYDCSVLPPQRR
jgi:hypothetical protein